MTRWTTIWLFITKGYRGRMLLSMLGIMISLMFVVGVLDLIKTVETSLMKEMNVEKGTIYARQKSISVGVLDLSSIFGKPGISNKLVDEVDALPGIKSIHKETWSRFPLRLDIGKFGRGISTDATLLGVEKGAIEDEFQDAFEWTPPSNCYCVDDDSNFADCVTIRGDECRPYKPRLPFKKMTRSKRIADVEYDYKVSAEEPKPIPILAPKILLTAFNAGFADANGLPRISDQAVKALDAKATVWPSRQKKEKRKGSKKISFSGLGVTTYGNNTTAGIVPIESIYWLNEELDIHNPKLISGLAIAMEGEASPDQVNELLDQRGLDASDTTQVAEMFSSVSKMLFFTINIIGAIMYISGAVILFILYKNQMLERAPSLRTLTKLGVKRRALIGVLLVENIIMTSLGIVLGYFAGRTLSAFSLPSIESLILERFGLTMEMPTLLHHDESVKIVVLIAVLTVMVNIPNMLGILRRR